MVKLEDLGLTARGLPSCVNYGVEVVESLVNLVNEMKGQLLKSRPAHTDREQTLATNI